MFTEWGFLLAEIWVLIALAVLLGLLAGWIIWGGRDGPSLEAEEVQRLRLALEKERARARASVTETASKGTGATASVNVGYVRPNVAPLTAATAASASAGTQQTPDSPPRSKPDVAPVPDQSLTPAPDPTAPPKTVEPTPVLPAQSLASGGARPAGLDAPQDGIPDDLTKIKGIGPKLERLCNQLGFYHYEQIASWTDAEVAWVDDNLADFKGRVTRDGWVAQAKTLAAQGAPAFVRRTDH